ncbi:MAG: ATPase [Rhodocyclaceae bacterium]|nr:ATPase [Rhodocyclaceae bacterium]
MNRLGLESTSDRKVVHLMEKEHAMHVARPAALRDVEATGLSFPFLVELMLKIFFQGGQLRLWDIKERIKLPLAVIEPLIAFMRTERLCELQGHSVAEADIAYILTDLGRARAMDAFQKNQYAGPCPVTLDAYTAQVERQSVSNQHIGREAMQQAFSGVILADGLVDRVGPALNSARSIFIYGPSGSGKTYVAERMAQAMQGAVWVPYAFAVDSEVIQVFDPLVHKPIDTPADDVRSLDRRHTYDERWVKCARPVIITGGELTLSMLDLEFDPLSRFYSAPPQVKANNGLFIVDDLGRQRVAAKDLLNRWIIPMDRRVDYLALHNGKKFRVPFDVAQVFSTNLAPEELADDAFLRRLGYKIYVGATTPGKYRDLFQQACSRLGVAYSEDAFNYLLGDLHNRSGRPLYACYPYDLVSKVRDRSLYEGLLPELSQEMLEWAWLAYFGPIESAEESHHQGGLKS